MPRAFSRRALRAVPWTISAALAAVACGRRRPRQRGHDQDTLLVGTTNVATIQRAYFKACTIEGDVDFICGRATAVFDGGEIRQATDRRTNGNIVAPSTDARNPFGFLITGVNFTAEAGVQTGGVTVGRAWDCRNSKTRAPSICWGTEGSRAVRCSRTAEPRAAVRGHHPLRQQRERSPQHRLDIAR